MLTLDPCPFQYLERPLTPQRLEIEASKIRKIRDAWRAHPCYDGNDEHPRCRAICETRGPDTLSYSIDQWPYAYAQLHRMAKQHLKALEIRYYLAPILPDDPYHPYMVVDDWNLPNAAGARYQARARFRKLFPALRPALRQASKLHRMPAWRCPDTGRVEPKKVTSLKWFQKQEMARAASRLRIMPEEIWNIAAGKLTAAEVEQLGVRQLELNY